jgi:hypothetical protein
MAQSQDNQAEVASAALESKSLLQPKMYRDSWSSPAYEQQSLKDFYELLFTKPLVPYFRSVFKTNMNGFNSSTPSKGLWEVYVYEQSNFRSGARRTVRSNFVNAVKALGQHLHDLDEHNSGSRAKSTEILAHIREHGLTADQEIHFSMFFNIVDDNKKDSTEKATSISVSDYRRLTQEQLLQGIYRVNVKTLIQGLNVAGAFSKNYHRQQGGANFIESLKLKKLALITTFLPLVLKDDSLPANVESLLGDNSFTQFEDRVVTRIVADLSERPGPGQGEAEEEEGNIRQRATGANLRGGADEDRAAILRVLCQQQFEFSTDGDFEVLNIAPEEEVARYLACNPESTRVPSVLSNTLTLAALPTNSWRKLSDGSYEKLTPQGYQPLSKEECERVLQGTCAGSAITDSAVCQQFMEAVNSQNEQAILELLGSSNVWQSNAAADSLSKLHPETVIRILKALKFGTKNGPFGKRVCTVDEWLSECVKGTTYAPVSNSLSPSMRSYLEHLVNFVNSNPSLIDPSKRPFAGRTFQNVPNVFTERGLYYAGEDMHSTNNLLTFADVNRAIQQHQSGINLLNVVMQPTMAYGAVLPQRGGSPYIYTQPAQAQLSLGNGISQLLEQTLNGLKATSYGISQEDEAKIREKVANLTTLEQEIYQNIMVLNEQRLAVESGVNLHSQLASTQDRLMHLGSMYDRRVPCLQELCEQLRMLLAQQQNKNGCQQIE